MTSANWPRRSAREALLQSSESVTGLAKKKRDGSQKLCCALILHHVTFVARCPIAIQFAKQGGARGVTEISNARSNCSFVRETCPGK